MPTLTALPDWIRFALALITQALAVISIIVLSSIGLYYCFALMVQ